MAYYGLCDFCRKPADVRKIGIVAAGAVLILRDACYTCYFLSTKESKTVVQAVRANRENK